MKFNTKPLCYRFLVSFIFIPHYIVHQRLVICTTQYLMFKVECLSKLKNVNMLIFMNINMYSSYVGELNVTI